MDGNPATQPGSWLTPGSGSASGIDSGRAEEPITLSSEVQRAADVTAPLLPARGSPSPVPTASLDGEKPDFDLPVRAGAYITPADNTQQQRIAGSGAVADQPNAPTTPAQPTATQAGKTVATDPLTADYGVALLADAPSISLIPSTQFIPINANDSNHSSWKEDAAGNDMTGLPLVRDLYLSPMRNPTGWDGQYPIPPTMPITDDPDLKEMTATVTNPQPGSGIVIEVIYRSATDGGRIRLWQEASKQHQIELTDVDGRGVDFVGGAPGFPTATFYVEGTEPSVQANDITLRVKFTPQPLPPGPPPPPVTAETTLTVTPVTAEFSVTPKDGGQVTFLVNTAGQIVGLNSGSQARPGGDPDGTDIFPGDTHRAGLTFTADLNPRTGVAGDPQFLQTMTSVTNGNPSGISVTGLGNGNMQLRAGESFPILDTKDESKPFYPALTRAPNNGDRAQIMSADTPYVAEFSQFNNSTWGNRITRMDITDVARMNLVWVFDDETIYTLGYSDWQVIFRGSTPMGGVFTIDSASVITATPANRSHSDPDRVTGSVFNAVVQWVPVA